MFDNKKIKAIEDLISSIEEDIKILYKLFDNLDERMNSEKVFKSFISNLQEVNDSYQVDPHPYRRREMPEKEFEDVSTKTVVGMILDEMGLWVKYQPSKKEVVRETPSEFVLRSVEKF